MNQILRLKLIFTGILIIHISIIESNAQKSLNEMFDDFNYSDPNDKQLVDFGWTVRSGLGGPGADGCKWAKENVSFIDDNSLSGNKLMQLSAYTNGTGGHN